MLYPSRSYDSHSLIQHKPKDIHRWLREQAIFLLAPGSAPLGTEPPAAALQELVGIPRAVPSCSLIPWHQEPWPRTLFPVPRQVPGGLCHSARRQGRETPAEREEFLSSGECGINYDIGQDSVVTHQIHL